MFAKVTKLEMDWWVYILDTQFYQISESRYNRILCPTCKIQYKSRNWKGSKISILSNLNNFHSRVSETHFQVGRGGGGAIHIREK